MADLIVNIPVETNGAWERLLAEHQELKDVLDDLKKKAERIRGAEELLLQSQLEELYGETSAMLHEMELHSRWEAGELFPQLAELYRTPEGYRIVTTLWMLEKEHELTDEYFRLFFTELEGWKEDRQEKRLHLLVDYLLVACRFVEGHLQMEEDTLMPLMEG